MVSRTGTTNLSNMPVESEGVYSIDTTSSNDSLASSLAALRIGGVDGQWKVTHFEKSPLVCGISISNAVSKAGFRCLLI